jgi:hypothetical protein
VVRRGNGCTDTGNNANDFVVIGPIPRNSGSPANSCGGDPTKPSGLGIASPSALDPASKVTLTVAVTPASVPPSTGIHVVADLSGIGGDAAQVFYDDGSNGDVAAGDNVFTFQQLIGAHITTGAKNIVATITDNEGRSVTAPITLTVLSPTCGVERWSVKTGTDPDAAFVDLANPAPGSILLLGLIPPPPDPPGPPANQRVVPQETTVFTFDATMTLYKFEDDVDYHIVLSDEFGNTLVSEIPSPACVGVGSPFASGIASARATFDAKLHAQTFFQTANLPVRVTGVGFFDFKHGQTGVAPNGIEIHPILDIKFTTPTTTSIGTSGTPSQYAQSVTFSIAVTNGGAAATATGSVGIFDSGVQIGTASLDPSGQTTYTTDSLSVATHTISARYFGDGVNAPSSSIALSQVVDKADQTITFAALPDKMYGAAPLTVSATGGGSSNPVTFAATGNCTSSGTNGSTITITSGGSCTVTASQAGNGNYNAAPDVSRSFNINQADAIINVTGYTGVYDGQAHGATGTAKGAFGEDLSSLLDLGAKFTDVPGGTANWTFAGNVNYAAKNGTANIVISKATPAFSNLSAPTINVGTASTAISGTIALGSLIPTGTVAITLNGVTQNAAIGVNGSFSSTFATGGLAVISPAYTVSFSYGGDTNFAAASGSSALTVTYVILPLYDVTRSFGGKVVPIRMELANVSGADLSAPGTVVNAVKVVEVSTSTSSDVQDAGNNTPDLDFRFDPTLGVSGGYIFNLNATTLSSGSYSLLFSVRGDPVQHSILFQIK